MSWLLGGLLEEARDFGTSTNIRAIPSGVGSPAGGDDLGSFLAVSDGEGAYGGAVPEGIGLILLVIDGLG